MPQMAIERDYDRRFESDAKDSEMRILDYQPPQNAQPERPYDAVHLLEHLLLTFYPLIRAALSPRQVSAREIAITLGIAVILSAHLLAKSYFRRWAVVLAVLYGANATWLVILFGGHFLRFW